MPTCVIMRAISPPCQTKPSQTKFPPKEKHSEWDGAEPQIGPAFHQQVLQVDFGTQASEAKQQLLDLQLAEVADVTLKAHSQHKVSQMHVLAGAGFISFQINYFLRVIPPADILSGMKFHLAFYLAFRVASYLTYILAFYLTYILSYFWAYMLAFYSAYTFTYVLPFCVTFDLSNILATYFRLLFGG